jgi:hypothetical protein
MKGNVFWPIAGKIAGALPTDDPNLVPETA